MTFKHLGDAMARIRTIKPEFFTHYELFLAESESGLPLRTAYAGLFTLADREGRFKWIPPQLKLGCLPYDDLDFSRVLDALATRDFIKKYRVKGVDYGVILAFKEHQVINNKEKRSILPGIDESDSTPCDAETSTRDSRVEHASTSREVNSQGEGKGREGKGKEQDILAVSSEPPPNEEKHLPEISKSEKKKSSPRRRKLPNDFLLTEERATAAQTYWLGVGRADLVAQFEFEKFLNHHRQHGKAMACWESAWRTWYTNAVQFNKAPSSSGNGTTRDRSLIQDLTDTDW